MNEPLYYYPHMEMKYRIVLDEQKGSAITAKERLMAVDSEIVNLSSEASEFDDSKYRIAIEVWRYFNDAIFFHDKEAIKKLKELKSVSFSGKFNHLSRWFISLEDIHQQYQNIRQHNIRVDSLLAYGLIRAHLALKFCHELLMSYAPTVRDDIRMSKLTKDLINLKKRREYSGSNPKTYNDIYELLINNVINEFIKMNDSSPELNFEFNVGTFIDFSKGKTESSYLRILLEECFSYNEREISKTKLLGVVFDLFRLLMPDRILMDDKTFYETPDLSYKSYSSYKAQVLRKIIYPKRKTKRVSSDLGSQSWLY